MYLCPLGTEEPIFTQLGRGFGSSAEHLHIAVGPGHHVARHVVGTIGYAEHVLGPQHTVPDVEVAQLAHKGLSGVEAAAHNVLLRP